MASRTSKSHASVLFNGVEVSVARLNPACIVTGCVKVVSNVYRLKAHLLEAHSADFAHLGRLVCVCRPCGGKRRFFDMANAASKHPHITAYSSTGLAVPIEAYDPAKHPVRDAFVLPVCIADGAAAFLAKLPDLPPKGKLRSADGCVFTPIDAGHGTFACAEQGCARHRLPFSNTQRLRAHLIDAHSIVALAKRVCVCERCQGLRVFADDTHARAYHMQIVGYDVDVHLRTARAPDALSVRAPLRPSKKRKADDALKPAVCVKDDDDDDDEDDIAASASLTERAAVTPVLIRTTDGGAFAFTPFVNGSSQCMSCCSTIKGPQLVALRKHVTAIHRRAVVGGCVCNIAGCNCGKPFAAKMHLMAHVRAQLKRVGIAPCAELLMPAADYTRLLRTCLASSNPECACGAVFASDDAYAKHAAAKA